MLTCGEIGRKLGTEACFREIRHLQSGFPLVRIKNI